MWVQAVQHHDLSCKPGCVARSDPFFSAYAYWLMPPARPARVLAQEAVEERIVPAARTYYSPACASISRAAGCAWARLKNGPRRRGCSGMPAVLNRSMRTETTPHPALPARCRVSGYRLQRLGCVKQYAPTTRHAMLPSLPSTGKSGSDHCERNDRNRGDNPTS